MNIFFKYSRFFYRFILIELSYWFISLFSNPYRVCRKFNQKMGEENIHYYGETPYATYRRIAEKCQIGPHDTWIEMGAGRGKGCFWLSLFIKCRVIGIERVPQFVLLAKAIKALFRVRNVTFEKKDMEKADLNPATFIYLYGFWPDLKIPLHAKILTISEPLPGLKVLKTFRVSYPWGRTTAFLQEA